MGTADVITMRALLLVFVFWAASVAADPELKLEHHEHTAGVHPHKDREALYRFTVDNYDADNRAKEKASNLVVEAKLPMGVDISEKYFYLEGYKTADEAFRECAQKNDGDQHVLVRCEISKVTNHVTMYLHAAYPKDKFSAAELAAMERAGSKVTATLSRDNRFINEVSQVLLKHWRDEL